LPIEAEFQPPPSAWISATLTIHALLADGTQCLCKRRARVVLVERELHRGTCGPDRLLLGLDLLERRENGLTVIGDGRIVGAACRRYLRPPRQTCLTRLGVRDIDKLLNGSERAVDEAVCSRQHEASKRCVPMTPPSATLDRPLRTDPKTS
jgi:hypothetical protein